MSTVKKRILGFGRYKDPEDMRRPFWVSLAWFEGKPPLVQPVSELELFTVLNDFVTRVPVEIDVEIA